MPTQSPSRRLAVLIDAENISPKTADRVFRKVATMGDAIVRRIYGNCASTHNGSWSEAVGRHGIVPQLQFANTPGKNAADITLVIDAMDLLHGGLVDGFCLVSSDSDFTRLATRIREQGLDVFGFGEQKAPESFRHACREFFCVEDLVAPRQADGPVAKAVIEPLAAAEKILAAAVGAMKPQEDWIHLGELGSRARALSTNFTPRRFGYKSLSELMRASTLFDVRQTEGKGCHVRLSIKRVAKSAA